MVRHESELGRWELVRRAPEQQLRAYVGDYQGYVESGTTPVLRQQVPTTRLPLIFNLGAPWSIGASPGEPRELCDSFAAGLFDRSTYVAAAGPASCVQVDVTPVGAHMLLGLPMHELANLVVPIDSVLPPGLGHLPERLAVASSWEQRFELLDSVLVARLAQARTPSADVAWAWKVLERSHGRAPIGGICDRLGRSRRHLAARFREQVGLPPKTVARIFRFDRAVSMLAQPGAGLAGVAVECGYYDQAHLNRDFREFAGTSPAAFARQMMPDGGVVV